MPTAEIRIERWTKAVGAEQDAWLKAGLTAGLPELRMSELFACRPDIFQTSEFLVIATDAAGRAPLAVLGACWQSTLSGVRFLHIGVQFVVTAARGSEVFRRSWRELLGAVGASGEFPTISALKTFNPVAYCAMRAYGRLPGAVMYPELEREPDLATVRLAQQIAQALAPNHAFDPGTGVISDIGLPRDLYRSRPTCEDAAVDDHFRRHLSPGDRLLSVVHVRERRTAADIQQRFGR